MTISQHAGVSVRVARFVALAGVVLLLAGCNLFGQPKIKEEPIIPPDTLYQQALGEMDKQRYVTAIATLEKLERQHPFSEFNEKAKMMEIYANYRIGRFPEAILAADRYLALFPSSKEVPYVLYLKGNSYFGQIKDITRDQQISKDAIETYSLIVANYPKSEYAKDAREKMVIAVDQIAGKEMSVGRYYLGNGNYPAAINRFRMVAEQFQTSTHIEESLYRLVEANLQLGLVSEAQTAAAVLGHNYPQSTWYKQAFDLLAKQGISPQVNPGSSLAQLKRT
ncbi:outer membrane protein assembly factor BamD [Devosia sp. ZB163]|uniref:outer membrane protein assembly factor BamD n=1 Tax=Devosia sp. ZB163 TaxID=3025938 RepID=UPI00235E1C28|nr:outer membrane protein assembly factor BamD [Devosia sp. ZB163]MDC9825939.1 outer membrane protein assembly factor BamD [Devosia sp. ZB163]